MHTRQLKNLLSQIEALKTPETSEEFQAGVDAAYTVLNAIVQEAQDHERMQKLESELTQLRAKYPDTGQAAPKRRGRRPKAAAPSEPEFEVVTGA